MSKHTPPPWDDIDFMDLFSKPTEELEANIKLMNASPEMLVILIGIEMCLNDKIPIEFNDPFHKSIHNVIKKATP